MNSFILHKLYYTSKYSISKKNVLSKIFNLLVGLGKLIDLASFDAITQFSWKTKIIIIVIKSLHIPCIFLINHFSVFFFFILYV